MAHSCPYCGQMCYCGGDIDDCCFHNTPEEGHCRHCPLDGEDDAPDGTWDGSDDDDQLIEEV